MKMTQRAFTSGEVSEAVAARSDLDWYSSALLKCENAYVRTQGGVYNREGTRHVGRLPSSVNFHTANSIPFIFSQQEAYVLVFLPRELYLIFNGNIVRTGTDPNGPIYKLVTPFVDPRKLSYSTFGDTMTLVDGSNDPYELKRITFNNWVLQTINFNVFVKPPDSVALTRIPKKTDTTVNYSYAVTSVVDVKGNDRESLPTFATKNNVVFITSVDGMNIKIIGEPNVIRFRIYKSLSSESRVYGIIGDVIPKVAGNKKEANFVDFNYAPDMSETPPNNKLPFEGEGNKPRICGFYQQRRIFAATDNNPQRVFCSQTGLIDSMQLSIPSQSTDAIIQDIVSASINSIRHIVDIRGLILLTAEGEIKVTEGKDFVLTSESFGGKEISNYGSSKAVPIRAGDSIIFSQEQGARLIGLNVSDDDITGGNLITGNDLSIRAEHVFEGRTITSMAYAKEPYSIIWCILDNGGLVGLTYNREHKVWGFHKHKTDGFYVDVVCIPRGRITGTYFMVSRKLYNWVDDFNHNLGKAFVDRFYIEEVQDRKDLDVQDSFFVDCGLSYESVTPISEIRGLIHLARKEVSILADGVVVNKQTVSDAGIITLEEPARKIQVGLPYETNIQTLPLDSVQRSYKGRRKSVNLLYLNIFRSLDVEVAQEGSKFTNLVLRKSSNIDPLKLITREVKMPLTRGSSYGGKINIRHTKPLPFALLSITPEFSSE